MDLEGIMLSDISPKNAIYNFIYMQNLKKKKNTHTNEKTKQNGSRPTDTENKGFQRRGGGG